MLFYPGPNDPTACIGEVSDESFINSICEAWKENNNLSLRFLYHMSEMRPEKDLVPVVLLHEENAYIGESIRESGETGLTS